jgi:hypothetical protein
MCRRRRERRSTSRFGRVGRCQACQGRNASSSSRFSIASVLASCKSPAGNRGAFLYWRRLALSSAACSVAPPPGAVPISTYQVIIVALGALAGGFVNGLTGFGTGITAMGIWLYAISPTVAATLVIISSVVSQLQTLPMIWHAIESGEARGLTPFNPFYGYRGLLMLRPEEIL